MTRRRAIILAIALVVIAGALFAMRFPLGEHARLHSPARRAWKNDALLMLAHTSAESNSIQGELAALKAIAANGSSDTWIGTNVLAMTNGEYLVYSHIDAKQNSRIDDLFIAHGSNGKWYYSTYHFCIGMIVLRMDSDEPPGSISEFARRYFVREFDGKSDECLQRTWPVKH